MLRFGLIGYGTHAKWAVRNALERAEHAQLVAVADVRPESLEQVGDPTIATYTDYGEMIAKEPLDAVYVATPPDAHEGPTVCALEAGLHVLCEKPMAETAEACERMLAAAERSPGILAIDFENRFIAHRRQVRQWITDGKLGEVKAIHWQQFWDGHKIWGEIGQRRARLTNLAGSLDCSIHELDLARYFVGGGQWEEIHALGMWFGEDLRKPPHTSMIGRLSNGVMVTLNSSFAYTAYIEAIARSDVMAIVGTKGVVNAFYDNETEMPVAKLTSESGVETVEMVHAPHNMAIAWVIDELCDLADGRKASSDALATGYDGWMAQVVTDEVNRQAMARRVD